MKKNMLWNAVGNVVFLGCQWLVTVLVTRLGGLSDAGVLSIAMSVSATFQTLALFGIRNYQVSDVEEKHTDTCYVFFRLLSCAAALLFCMGFSLFAAYRGRTLLAILLFMLFRLTEDLSDVFHGIAQKNGRLDIAGKGFFIKGVGLLAFFLLGYYLSEDLILGLLAMTLFSVASTLLYDLLMTRRVKPFGFYAGTRAWLSLAKETLPLCAYLFFSSAITTTPKLILERTLGGDVLGAYASIFAPALLIQAALSYIYTPFAQVLGKHRQSGDKRAFLSLSGKITGVLAVLTLLMVGAAALLGEPLLTLLFGETIRPYVSLLIPILLSIAAFSLFAFLCMLAVVLRNFRFLLLGCGAGFLLSLLLSRPFILRFGADGASYSLILAALGASLFLFAGVLYSLFKPGTTEAPTSQN